MQTLPFIWSLAWIAIYIITKIVSCRCKYLRTTYVSRNCDFDYRPSQRHNLWGHAIEENQSSIGRYMTSMKWQWGKQETNCLPLSSFHMWEALQWSLQYEQSHSHKAHHFVPGIIWNSWNAACPQLLLLRISYMSSSKHSMLLISSQFM